VLIHDAVGETPDTDDAALWADGLGLTYPVLADVDADFYPVWDPDEVLPVTYIIDREGIVRWAEAGGTGQLEEIEAFIVDLLDER